LKSFKMSNSFPFFPLPIKLATVPKTLKSDTKASGKV
jgi:hypothetical protein